MEDYLRKIVKMQKAGEPVGIYSACTGNEIVLEACMRHAKETGTVLLIESTANQVDQYGGYTGMKPADFVQMCEKLSECVGLPMDRIILGGDHLGPLTFAHYEEKKAMEEAEELIRQYVMAGFTKIHIDTSMKVASDDPEERLSDEIIARRGAVLAKTAEDAYKKLKKERPDAPHPVYIVGSEVPIPGGSQDEVDTGVQVTKVSDFQATVKAFQKAYEDQGLKDAWKYVIAVVVQPGVEEKDSGCTEYVREKAVNLMNAIKDHPEKQSYFMEALDSAVQENPKYYQSHYHGSAAEVAYKRKYSFSDRCRYYYNVPEVEAAIEKLFDNFRDGVPLGLLDQFMPIQYTKVRTGMLENNPKTLVMDRICNCIDEYLYGTMQEKIG